MSGDISDEAFCVRNGVAEGLNKADLLLRIRTKAMCIKQGRAKFTKSFDEPCFRNTPEIVCEALGGRLGRGKRTAVVNVRVSNCVPCQLISLFRAAKTDLPC